MGYDPFAPSLAYEVEQAIEQAGRAAEAAGKIIGGFFGLISPELRKQRMAQGYRLFMFGNEFNMMARTGRQVLQSLGRG